jgi:hypothetical protein
MMTYKNQCAIWLAGLLTLFLTLPARAQLQVGENTSMNLNANVSFGYSADYSNYAGSDHTLTPSGNADLSGHYYDPGFLSFDVQPFYNQSRANSTYHSIFQSGGINGSASIFSGSHFPGFVSYSKIYNSEGGFVVPGVGNLTTRGNSDNLVLGWGIQVPDYPRVSFQFADGNNTSSVFGTTADATFHSRTYGVVASDTWEGFNFNGSYHHNTVSALTPDFFTGQGAETSNTSSNSFELGVTHRLPWHGSFSAGAGRSTVNSDASGERFNGTIDTASSGLSFQPVSNLNFGISTQYTNNLEGSLYQAVITSGAIVPTDLLHYSTHSLDINGQASYVVPSWHLTFLGSVDRREQTLLGDSVSADSLDEMATYGNVFLRGFLTISAGSTQTAVNGINAINATSSRGYFTNSSYTRKLERWNLSGGFHYSRNTQTVLIGYTSSGYGYSAGIGRKFGVSSYWSVNASETKSKVNGLSGSDNFNQSYSTSLSVRPFSVSASYGKADGTSILTPTGLTPISTPTPILSPLEKIVFNGKTYAFGASTNFLHGLVLSGSYSRTKSGTVASSAFSENTTAQLITTLQYKVRQLWITGGYLKLQQGFSITGQPPTSYSSYFIGVTRWFKFF